MHEMSIALNIIDLARREMADHDAARLKGVRLRIGALAAVEPDSLRFCFEAVTGETPLSGALLHIEEVPLCGRCGTCGAQFELDRYFLTPCPGCGGRAEEIVSGRELDIVSLEVE